MLHKVRKHEGIINKYHENCNQQRGLKNDISNGRLYKCHKCQNNGQIEMLVYVHYGDIPDYLDRRVAMCECETGLKKRDISGRKTLFEMYPQLTPESFNYSLWYKAMAEIELEEYIMSLREEDRQMFLATHKRFASAYKMNKKLKVSHVPAYKKNDCDFVPVKHAVASIVDSDILL